MCGHKEDRSDYTVREERDLTLGDFLKRSLPAL